MCNGKETNGNDNNINTTSTFQNLTVQQDTDSATGQNKVVYTETGHVNNLYEYVAVCVVNRPATAALADKAHILVSTGGLFGRGRYGLNSDSVRRGYFFMFLFECFCLYI